MVDITDACETVRQLINGDANYASNVNGNKPLIINANNGLLRVDGGNQSGVIKIYQINSPPSYESYAARKRQDRIYRVGIEFNGFRSRSSMMSNVRRVREILEYYQAKNLEGFTMSNVTDPVYNTTITYNNPFNRMYEVSDKDLSISSKASHHKFVIDVELVILGQVRATSL